MRIVRILILFLGVSAINVSGKPAGNRRTILLTDDKIGVKKRNEDSSSGYYLEQCGIVKFPKSRRGVVNVLAFLDSSWPYSHRQAIMLKMLNERLQRSGLPDTLFFVVNVDPYFSRKIDKTEDDIEKEAWLGVSPDEIDSFSEIDKTFDSLAKSIDPEINLIQDNEDLNIWKNLRGSRDQVLVIDRCGKLTYQVIVPWSILHFPYVKAAILSTYKDEPCGPCDILDEKAVEKKDDLQMSLGITESLNNDLVTLGDVSGGNSHISKSIDDPSNVTESEINVEASNTSETTFSDFFSKFDNATVLDATTRNLIAEDDFLTIESGTKMNEDSTPSMIFAVNFTAEENSSRVIEDYPISSTLINDHYKVDDNPEITDKINYHGTNINTTDSIIPTTTEVDLDSQTRVVEAEEEFVDFEKVLSLKNRGEKYESTDVNLIESDIKDSSNQNFIASDIENDNETTSPSSIDRVDTTTEIISDFPTKRVFHFEEIFLDSKMENGSVDSTDSIDFDTEESKSGTTANDYEITRPTSIDGVDTTQRISNYPTTQGFNFEEIFLASKMGNGSVDSTDSIDFDTEESKSGTTTNDYEITRPTSIDGVDTTKRISDYPTTQGFNFKEIFLASKMRNGSVDSKDSIHFDTEESKSGTTTKDYEISRPTSIDGVDTTKRISDYPTTQRFNFKEIFLASEMGNGSIDSTDSIDFDTEESKSGTTANDYEITKPTSIDGVDATEGISDYPTTQGFNFREIFLASEMGNGSVDSKDSIDFDTEESKSGATANDYEITRPTSIDGVDITKRISDYPTTQGFNFKEIFLASKMGNGSVDSKDSIDFDTEESNSGTTANDYEITRPTSIDGVDATKIISDYPSTQSFHFEKGFVASKMGNGSVDSTDSTNFDAEESKSGTTTNDYEITRPTSIDGVDATEIISDYPSTQSFHFEKGFVDSKMGNGSVDSTDSTNFDAEESKSGTTANDYEITRPTSIDGVDATEIIADYPSTQSFHFEKGSVASKMGNGSVDLTDLTNFATEQSRSATKDYETTSDTIDSVDATTQIISDFSTRGFYYEKKITASKMEDTSYDSSTDSTNFDTEDRYFGTAENNPDISVETTKSTLYSNKPRLFTINKEALKNDDPEMNQDKESDKVEETLSSYMPIRIIMHAPHFHVDGDSTRMHEYLVLKTRNPQNHGHLSSYDATRLYRGPQDYQEKQSNLTASEVETKEWSMRNLIFNRDESPGLYGEVADYWRDVENPENYEYTEETERPIEDKNEERISIGDEIFQDKTNGKDSKKIVDTTKTLDHVTDELIPEMQTKEAAEFNAEDEETRSELIAHYSKLLPWIYYVLDK